MASRAVTLSASKKRKNGQVSVVDVARNGGSGGSGVGGGLSTHVARNGGSGVSGVGGGFSTPPHMMVNGFVTMDE